MVVNPTTTPSPVAPQVIATTTDGATNDDEVVKPTKPLPSAIKHAKKAIALAGHQQPW